MVYDLKKLNQLSSEEKKEGNKNFFLFMLGTETNYTSAPTTDTTYPNGETLSYIAQLIAKQLNEADVINFAPKDLNNPDVTLQFSSPSVKVVKGPTNLGSEVGDRIAEGVLLCLEALASGKNNIQITGHSRGAVESILITHELDRIKKELEKASNTKSFYEIVCDSPESVIKNGFKKALGKGAEDVVLDFKTKKNLLDGLPEEKRHLFIIDPVPGLVEWIKVPILGNLAWDDARFYEKPKCNSTELIVYRDERDVGFRPIVPEGVTPVLLPGHHGTGSGATHDQSNVKVPLKQSKTIKINESNAINTACVQKLMLCKLLENINKNTQLFSVNSKNSIQFDGVHKELNPLTEKYVSADKNGRQELLSQTYDAVHKNNDAFLYYQTTGYKGLNWLWSDQTSNKHRNVQVKGQGQGIDTLVNQPENHFVNDEHVSLYINKLIELDPVHDAKRTPQELMSKFESNFKGLLNKLNPNIPNSGARERSAIIEVIKEPYGAKLVDALATYLEAIGEKYFQSDLSKDDKAKLFTQLSQIINDSKQFNTDDPVVKHFFALVEPRFKTVLTKIAEARYLVLHEQTTLMNENLTLYADDPSRLKRVIRDFLKDDLAPIVMDLTYKDSSNQELSKSIINAIDSESETFKSNIIQKLIRANELLINLSEHADLNPKILKEEYDKIISSLQSGCTDSEFFYTKRILGFLISKTKPSLKKYMDLASMDFNIMLTDLNKCYSNLSDLDSEKTTLKSFLTQNFPLAIDDKDIHADLERLVQSAAQLLSLNKYDLHQKPKGMDDGFWVKVKKYAINNLDMPNPEFEDLKKKLDSITVELSKTIEQNDVLNLQLVERQKVVDQFQEKNITLSSQLNDQVQLNGSLADKNTELKEKAKLDESEITRLKKELEEVKASLEGANKKVMGHELKDKKNQNLNTLITDLVQQHSQLSDKRKNTFGMFFTALHYEQRSKYLNKIHEINKLKSDPDEKIEQFMQATKQYIVKLTNEHSVRYLTDIQSFFSLQTDANHLKEIWKDPESVNLIDLINNKLDGYSAASSFLLNSE